ncbi:MAG TPA: glycosyltransferase family 2 protein [Solirubrobacteraceae bacterium]|nr:glycosyltransferase family 2 protein [Solirubrobacteraceae bacterium]
MSPSIDVVIVAHGRYELTDSCLRHLAAQSLDHRVVLVDNDSPDETRRRVAEDWPRVELLAFERNRGFTAACNAGAASGEGEVIVLLNNDVDCRRDFLERLVAPLREDQRTGSVAAVMLQPGEELIDSAGLTADRTLAGFPRMHGMGVGHAGDERPLLLGPAGTAAAYRRAAWDEAEGLDEAIFAYMEDFDLALRLRSAGWATALASDARGVHAGSATFGHRSAVQRRMGGFSRGYMLRRYGVLRGRSAVRALATETAVMLGDAAISRDLAATRGRLAGWRAARGLPRRPVPPAEALDATIGLRDSLALRRGVYARSDRGRR